MRPATTGYVLYEEHIEDYEIMLSVSLCGLLFFKGIHKNATKGGQTNSQTLRNSGHGGK